MDDLDRKLQTSRFCTNCSYSCAFDPSDVKLTDGPNGELYGAAWVKGLDEFIALGTRQLMDMFTAALHLEGEGGGQGEEGARDPLEVQAEQHMLVAEMRRDGIHVFDVCRRFSPGIFSLLFPSGSM